jgi:hypothetical protein
MLMIFPGCEHSVTMRAPTPDALRILALTWNLWVHPDEHVGDHARTKTIIRQMSLRIQAKSLVQIHVVHIRWSSAVLADTTKVVENFHSITYC